MPPLPPGAGSISMGDALTILQQLTTENVTIFEPMARTVLYAWMLILFVLFGLRMAFEGVTYWEVVKLVLKFSIAVGMVNFYSSPIPGAGFSFSSMIASQGTYMASLLQEDMVGEISRRLSLMYWSMEAPGLSAMINMADGSRWGITILLIAGAYTATYCVVLIGYIFGAICLIAGPFFVPFFIIPEMEWLFWGWLRAFLQYSFYPFAASAYTFVFGKLLINFLDHAGTDYSLDKIALMFMPLCAYLATYVWGMLKLPSFVNSLITGKSGEGAFAWLMR
jgi:hypothetical protein